MLRWLAQLANSLTSHRAEHLACSNPHANDAASRAPPHIILPYRVYTRAHDIVISNDAIDAAIAEYPDNRFPTPDFAAFSEAARPLCEPAISQVARALEALDSSEVAITVLIDHSGSVRKHDLCLTAIIAGALSSCLDRAGVSHEILGFTTRSWRGGKSRIEWMRAGEPPFPGRLCDLLHVIHRSFGETQPLSWDAMERMTHAGLCKENVDGEALLRAAERLRAKPSVRKILIIISDGAPVDDTTLMFNGPDILTEHLQDVADELIRTGDIEIYGVSTTSEHWLPWYYPQYLVCADVTDVANTLLPFLGHVVASPTSAPCAAQIQDE